MIVPARGREAILNAVVHLLATRGPDDLSVRNVAARADVSAGAVQHHFPTKSALLVAAMNAVTERFRARLELRLTGVSSAEERLRVFCSEIACIDGEGLTDAVVWTTFAARACTDPEIRQIHAKTWKNTEAVVAKLLDAAFPQRDVNEDDAASLLALVDGIAVARGSEQSSRMTAERAQRMIDRALALIGGARPVLNADR